MVKGGLSLNVTGFVCVVNHTVRVAVIIFVRWWDVSFQFHTPNSIIIVLCFSSVIRMLLLDKNL